MTERNIPERAMPSARVRVLTYNIHRWRGWDRRVRPQRILQLLEQLQPDIAALQEVVLARQCHPVYPTLSTLAHRLGLQPVLAPTRLYRGHLYGNLLLTRLPILRAAHYDLSRPGREPRSCLRVDLRIRDGQLLHVFNVHLGTSRLERERQLRELSSPRVLLHPGLSGIRLVLGDFNEWRPRRLRDTLASARLRGRPLAGTFPSVLPLLPLEQIFFDPHLELVRVWRVRTGMTRLASDHLPVLAEVRLRSR